MMTLRTQVSVPSKKSIITVQAPFYKQSITLQPREGQKGDYLRKPYEVKKGDTLESIAKAHDTTWQVLYQLNKNTIKDADKIQVEQLIKIPPKNSGLRGTSSSSATTSNQANNTTNTQSGDILDRTADAVKQGIDRLDKATQPIQDTVSDALDSGKQTVSGWFEKEESKPIRSTPKTQTGQSNSQQSPPEQAAPAVPKPIQIIVQQNGNRAGNAKEVVERAKPPIIFPLMEQPLNDPGKPYANFDWRKKLGEKGASQTVFNWSRNGGKRKHAGRDLYTQDQNADVNAKPGSPVVSIAPGVLLEVKDFYWNTHAVTISHTTEDGRKFIIRYGELDPKSVKHLEGRIGKPIKQGEILGNTGVLINPKTRKPGKIANGKNISMLHFEYFTGKGHSLDRADNLYSPNNIYQRRTDLADPLEILLEGYRASFLKPLPTTNGQISDKKIFSESDAKEALIKIADEYGKDMAVIIERMYRAETRHFDSKQYKYCGTPGMEAHGSSPYYGWDRQLFISPPIGTWSAFENAGLSKQGGNTQVTNSKKQFVCVDNVLVGMTYLAKYIQKHNGNYARWYSTDAKAQQIYRDKLSQIRPRIVSKL